MTKYFCDKCGEEITKKNSCVGGYVSADRLGTVIEFRPKGLSPTASSHKLRVEILTSFDGVANHGDFCKYCVIDAMNALDDRPTAE